MHSRLLRILILTCLFVCGWSAGVAVQAAATASARTSAGMPRELPEDCIGEARVPRNHWGSYEQLLRSGYSSLRDPQLLENIAGMDLELPDPCQWPNPDEIADDPPVPTQPLAERANTHAIWSPADMAQRRKQMGLIGPGPSGEVPQPVYP